jgi:hypothetical protein
MLFIACMPGLFFTHAVRCRKLNEKENNANSIAKAMYHALSKKGGT